MKANARSVLDRPSQLRRGLKLEALTVGWNVVEGAIAVAAGIMAGSIALMTFGIDSFVETTSALVVGWRLYAEMRHRSGENVEQVEAVTSRLVAVLLLALVIYIFVESLSKLFGSGARPAESHLGIAITALALAVMPLLSRAKLACANALDSAALRGDACQTVACAWLSATTLLGVGANAAFGWWWADPIAALLLIPVILREALEGWTGDHDDSN